VLGTGQSSSVRKPGVIGQPMALKGAVGI